MKKLSSFAVAMAAALALVATPALAQNAAAPSGGMPAKQDSMQGMKGMNMAKPMKKGMKTAMKHSCMDYAWQSQDQKDCEAGTKKPPSGR